MDPTTLALAVAVFTSVIVGLVGLLTVAKSQLVAEGTVTIKVNGEKEFQVEPGQSLLSAMASQQVFIPSACGGGGTCAMCKCHVLEGGGDVLPTEVGQLSLRERKEHVRLSCQVKVKQDLTIRVPDDVFGVKKFEGKVISNSNVATFIKELVVALPAGEEMDFEPGGYIQIDVPKYACSFREFDIDQQYHEDWDRFRFWDLKAANDEDGVFRAYSMANYPAEGDIVMLNIRIATPPRGIDVPPGLCSSYVFNLKPGDAITMSGPYGEFEINPTDREMIYVGGGAGMAPLRSQLYHLFNTLKTGRKVSYWYGARSKREIFYEEEFRALERGLPELPIRDRAVRSARGRRVGRSGGVHPSDRDRPLLGQTRRSRGLRVLLLRASLDAQGGAQDVATTSGCRPRTSASTTSADPCSSRGSCSRASIGGAPPTPWCTPCTGRRSAPPGRRSGVGRGRMWRRPSRPYRECWARSISACRPGETTPSCKRCDAVAGSWSAKRPRRWFGRRCRSHRQPVVRSIRRSSP